MKLAIGLIITHGYHPPTAFYDAYYALMQRVQNGAINQGVPADLQVDQARVIRSADFPTDVARNGIVALALTEGFDALLFLDADMTHPSDLIERLLSARKPVITARYHARKAPFGAVAYVKHRVLDGPHGYAHVHFGAGVFEIERCGAGALLIQRAVLEAIHARIGPNWFRYQRAPEPPHDFTVSEDFWFCQQAREAGYPIFVDWDVECGHVVEQVVVKGWNDELARRQAQDMLTLPDAQRQAIADRTIVCGIPDGITYPSGEHVPCYVVTEGER